MFLYLTMLLSYTTLALGLLSAKMLDSPKTDMLAGFAFLVVLGCLATLFLPLTLDYSKLLGEVLNML